MPPPPKTRNAEATKQFIIKAAEKLFAEKGFAGTSIREISQQSGVSGPLILFHFQSKEGVYQAVKAAIMERYEPVQITDELSEDSIRSFLKQLIGSMFAFYRDNPTMIRLANWGRLEGDTEPWPGEEQLLHAYQEFLGRAQFNGKIRDDITPFHISTIIGGAVHIWWEYHSHLVQHAAPDGNRAKADDEFVRQLLGFALRGLSPCSENKAPNLETKPPGPTV